MENPQTGNTKKSKAFLFKLAAVGMLVASLIFMYLNGGNAIYQSFTTHTVTTNATVTVAEKRVVHHYKRLSKYTCQLQYEFKVGNQHYVGPKGQENTEFQFTCPQIGKEIKVIYNPENPSENTLHFLNYSVMKFFLAGLMAAACIYIIFSPRKLLTRPKGNTPAVTTKM
ncbi:hypothetical protein HMPREF0044_0298 [Gleimia coleocanis DSM 15436]|uniref:DUF3592 domain-containing protein n=1 Tax=Gleimia coleocanis DSM 15436 TaxID=525245 RepID=C0VYQ8_9ACTO|nr:DUF3592 domain-containing protein [Gleimia coleocanis]EEH64561.1 hypothetical protein HMPREF0044_0298 [Gleimia coleocanis DSM 15436]